MLARDEVPGIRLGREGQLGWTTWLGARRAATDADDLILAPERRRLSTSPSWRRPEKEQHGGDQPRGPVRQAQPAHVQGRRGRGHLLQAAREPARRARALALPDRQHARLGRAPHPAPLRHRRRPARARPPGHAGAAAARRVDHRGFLRARAVRREGGLDVRDPPVRGLAGAKRLPAGRAPQERPPARRALADLARVRQDQGRGAHATSSRASSRARRRTA